ncbi:hypothetical protein BH11ARM2_BH11ARM2_11530 [soil metagenome]
MRDLDGLSGPWRGQSMQEGFRLSETIQLKIANGHITGQGDDSDGIFELTGGYDATGAVRIIRRYVVCNHGSDGVGVPYDYEGRWDGDMISGQWHERAYPPNGDSFEMWPESGESVSIAELLRESEPVPA